MKEIPETEQSFSLLAGVWFAVASLIPVVLIYLFLILDSPSQIIFLVLPFFILAISITFVCGIAFGSDILSPNIVKTSLQAMAKGIKVALLSYAVFIPLFAIGFALYFIIFGTSRDESITIAFFRKLFGGFVLAGGYGLLLIGWLLPIVGAAAGWLLFKYRLFRSG